MNINWKYILELWDLRNKEVKGDTPTKVESIQRHEMIEEIVEIQKTHTHLPSFARNLISRDTVSLRAMSTNSISAYVYGARMVAEAARVHGKDLDQRTLTQFFESRQQQPRVSNKKKKKSRRQRSKASYKKVKKDRYETP
jgi:hypothetical protein